MGKLAKESLKSLSARRTDPRAVTCKQAQPSYRAADGPTRGNLQTGSTKLPRGGRTHARQLANKLNQVTARRTDGNVSRGPALCDAIVRIPGGIRRSRTQSHAQ